LADSRSTCSAADTTGATDTTGTAIGAIHIFQGARQTVNTGTAGATDTARTTTAGITADT
jgi:hypothetical protein